MSPEGGTAATAVHVKREVPAPREQVYRTWTEPDLFKRWFTPDGFRENLVAAGSTCIQHIQKALTEMKKDGFIK